MKISFKRIRFKAKKIANIKIPLYLIAIFTSISLLLVQTYLWPDAGKRIESKRYIYSFEMDQWLHQAYNQINVIRSSGTFSQISLTTGEKKLNLDYFRNAQEYLFQVRQIQQILSYRGKVTDDVMFDVTFLLGKTYQSIDTSSKEKLTTDFKNFSDLAHKQIEMQKRIVAFEPELEKVLNGIPQDSSPDQIANFQILQINTVHNLLSDDDLMVSTFKDPLKFVRDFNEGSQIILEDYDNLLERYNELVEKQENYKNAILFALGFLSICLTIRDIKRSG